MDMLHLGAPAAPRPGKIHALCTATQWWNDTATGASGQVNDLQHAMAFDTVAVNTDPNLFVVMPETYTSSGGLSVPYSALQILKQLPDCLEIQYGLTGMAGNLSPTNFNATHAWIEYSTDSGATWTPWPVLTNCDQSIMYQIDAGGVPCTISVGETFMTSINFYLRRPPSNWTRSPPTSFSESWFPRTAPASAGAARKATSLPNMDNPMKKLLFTLCFTLCSTASAETTPLACLARYTRITEYPILGMVPRRRHGQRPRANAAGFNAILGRGTSCRPSRRFQA